MLKARAGLAVAPRPAIATAVKIPLPNPANTLNHNTCSYSTKVMHNELAIIAILAETKIK